MATPRISQARQVDALLKKFAPQIEAAFRKAIRDARGAVDQAALIDALRAGDVFRAAQIASISDVSLFPLDDAIRSAYVAGGNLVSLPSGLRGGFGFNGRHPRAEGWIRSTGATLIQGIQADTLEMTRAVITDGLASGTGLQSIARDITGRMVGGQRVGGFLGLTAQQADSIIVGRAKLLSGDPALMREYLQLKLRNRTNDALIQRAIAGDVKLTVAQVDRIIQGHKDKALAYRGKVIAKDQAFAAQAAGRREGYLQALARDDVEDVTVRWQHNLSEFPRPDHVAMDGTVISLRRGETFNFADASMTGPHDPAGGARHNIGCRCVGIYRVVVPMG